MQKPLIIASRGSSQSVRQTTKDFVQLLNGIKETASDRGIKDIPEIMDMHDTTKCIYFESTRRNFETPALWMVTEKVSIRFRVYLVFSMRELIFDVNCSKERGGFLFFDKSFEENELLKVVKKVIFDVFHNEDAFLGSKVYEGDFLSDEENKTKIQNDSEKVLCENKKDSEGKNSEKEDSNCDAISVSKISNETNANIGESKLISENFVKEDDEAKIEINNEAKTEKLDQKTVIVEKEIEFPDEFKLKEQVYEDAMQKGISNGFDKIISFFYLDNKIWMRVYVLDSEVKEIGPRLVLDVEKIFDGCFNGKMLYDKSLFMNEEDLTAKNLAITTISENLDSVEFNDIKNQDNTKGKENVDENSLKAQIRRKYGKNNKNSNKPNKSENTTKIDK
ncbi:hypothetical protein EDEG_00841 [Edhazardia aedis USNM 41457]|uniref:Brix domain-containing protein n=1 Tax=Edhazardia aedis (strain USNM 41457) TaxID=1003232 RepID=J9DR87_EDHAE|nr:hypothetical protein EDEG_00841 [Edhazardia aedis USNM 41457]|eukprot:EJW05060.1 hypothetical protein EDEG_00841 [Edhazardia aedis USNM 41457]